MSGVGLAHADEPVEISGVWASPRNRGDVSSDHIAGGRSRCLGFQGHGGFQPDGLAPWRCLPAVVAADSPAKTKLGGLGMGQLPGRGEGDLFGHGAESLCRPAHPVQLRPTLDNGPLTGQYTYSAGWENVLVSGKTAPTSAQ